jgi:hypothetical protein
MEFKNKIIGFIDVLGFKNMVKAAENGEGMLLPELMEVLKMLGSPESKKTFGMYGPTICPQSMHLKRDLDFKVTQISDCVIVSSEVSAAGVINLISHCWGAVIKLLPKGVMCRGYIAQGSVYHTDTQIIGSGYQEAYAKESQVSAFKHEADERGTPFVEIDPSVCGYIRDHCDECVKEMFLRMTKKDGETVALFPFKRLSHSFAITGDFNPHREKQSNQVMRDILWAYKEKLLEFRDPNNAKAMMKTNQYLRALDEQLAVCDKTDEMIDKLMSPFPAKRY